ncbi:DUF2188 domain-containing protein [Cupriavidus sp. H18C2]|uniref:DUF2188 domain-containing protein n=1 Tax=Cupriavidus sp. H18C2 TaxID=3241602 RepID=UPI003BF7D049
MFVTQEDAIATSTANAKRDKGALFIHGLDRQIRVRDLRVYARTTRRPPSRRRIVR